VVPKEGGENPIHLGRDRSSRGALGSGRISIGDGGDEGDQKKSNLSKKNNGKLDKGIQRALARGNPYQSH